jgi:WD40 repeat protein
MNIGDVELFLFKKKGLRKMSENYMLNKQKKIVHYLIMLLIVIWGLVGCNFKNSTDVSNHNTNLLNSLQKGENVVELAVLAAPEINNSVSGLCYQNQTELLYSVDSEDGTLIRWNVDTSHIDSINDIGIHSVFTIQFIADCNKLLGSNRAKNRAGRANIIVEHIGDVILWDTSSPDELECWGQCDDTPRGELIKIGSAIDDDGNRRIDYYDNAISINGRGINRFWFIRGSEETFPTIGKIVFSPSSTKYVIAYLEGGIRINDIRWVQRNTPNEKFRVDALAMDPNEKYIAHIQNHYLTVWKVSLLGKQEIINAPLGEENQVLFDQNGRFLFVSGQDHIQIWDLEEINLIHGVIAKGINVMTISNDNNLLGAYAS